jgi:hypothetical protein
MSTQTIDIVREQWDYLIVLDACRYDYFEKHWMEFIPGGTLHCRHSVGSCTTEWRDKSFPDVYDDIVYISANPQICTSSKVYGYCAGEHFFKVFEIWKDKWDNIAGTVLPSVMTDAALDILRTDVAKNKRVIIHYLQPHAPYISMGFDSKGHLVGDIKQRSGNIERDALAGRQKAKTFFFNLFYAILKHSTIFGNKPDWALRKFFNLPPKTPMEYSLRNHNIEELRKAYEQNLRIVLSEVVRLVQYLSGTIIVTSDHGELLGEKKNFSHPKNSKHPILRKTPWLKLEKTISELNYDKQSVTQNKSSVSEDILEETIIERLRALGYHD